MSEPMTHHSEPAREAVALLPCPFCGCAPNPVPQNDDCPLPDDSGRYHQTIWCENCGAEGGKRRTGEDSIQAWNRRASPAPAAGGLEAVREALIEAEAAFEAIRIILVNELEEPVRGAFWRAVQARDASRAALAAAAASRGEDWRPVLTDMVAAMNKRDSDFGDGEIPSAHRSLMWRAEQLLASPAATSAETQGGDGGREAVAWTAEHERAFRLAFEGYNIAADHFGDSHGWGVYLNKRITEVFGILQKMKRDAGWPDAAALAPSTSAATRGEPVAWSPMSTAPKGYPTEDAGCRGTSEWFFGRVTEEFRKHGAAPFVVIRRKAWPHEDDWECNGEAHYVPRYFDGWRPLNDHPAPAVESAQVKEARELVRASTALLNNLWQETWSHTRTHEENWKEFDRKFPGVKWLRDARDAELASEGRSDG